MRMSSSVLGCLVSLSLAGGASAADLPPPEPAPAPVEAADPLWTVRIQPYLWASSFSGTTKPFRRLPPVDVDMSFKDILDDLKFAGMIAGSVHYGRIGMVMDLQYVTLQTKGDTPGPFFGGAHVTTDSFIGTLMADYKVLDEDRYQLFASAGARIYWASTEVNLAAGVLPAVSGTGEDTWADPMLGLRGTFDITPKFFVNGWGYVGGFGVGSDIAGDVFGGVGYRFTDTIAANIGYRYLRVDRDTSSFVYDVEQHGVMAGLVISF